MAGPIPMPIEKQKKLGNPNHKSKINLNFLNETKLASSPPKNLGEEGKRVWTTVVTFAHWIGPTDAFTLELLATYADRRRKIQEELLIEGEVLTGQNGGKYLNPKTTLLISLDEKTIKLFSLLGLTPTDRTRLGINSVDSKMVQKGPYPEGSKLQKLKEKYDQSREI